MLQGNNTIFDKEVADTTEYMRLKKGRGQSIVASNGAHCRSISHITKKENEVSVQTQFYDIKPNGKIKMGMKDTKQKMLAS